MNYEEKYKQALEIAKHYHDRDNIHFLEHIFPELRESEDEKIRKALLEMVHDTTGDSLWVDYNVHKEDAIAWLEKQKDTNVLIQEASETAYTEGMRVERKHWLEKQGEQPSWSEEDDIRLNHLIDFIQKYGLEYYASIDKVIDFIHWLKSLKPNHWKPSEEQMKAIKFCCANFEEYDVLKSLYNDLKKLM